ncbi:MAG: MFS transporter [Planctomycetota bacterium]|jgi:nucleoside transporter|nr:MFS transporter [Planctomycetota bacterium]
MTNGEPARPLGFALGARLSFMMFLQYAIWGAWLPLLWPYLSGHLGFSPDKIGTIFAVGAVGAIVAPFIAGQIADRWFSTERFLGLSHLAGALLIWQLGSIDTYSGFLWFSLAYSIIYSPTLALTNSLSFHHIPDRDRDFGKIRLWGTLGWIVVGIGIGQWLLREYTPAGATDEVIAAAQDAGRADAFRVSAILGALMGIYCFFLPHTPPSAGKQKNATAEALVEIKRNPLLTLFLLAVPVSCIHQLYFVHTAGFLSNIQSDASNTINQIFGVGGGGLMTIGQVAEIAVLALIPIVSKSVSRKSLLSVGLLAYAGRMAIFAYGSESVPLIMAGIALHGLCFGCFIFVAFMIVDEETTGDVRASAQSLFNLVIVGIGIIVGSKLAGALAEWATSEAGAMDYTKLFSVPMWASLACLLLLVCFYPSSSPRTENAS